MNISQLGQPPVHGLAITQQKHQAQTVKPLTIEISYEDLLHNRKNLSLSSEAVNLYELRQTYPGMFEGSDMNVRFSGDVLHQLNQLMLLHRTMRIARPETNGTPGNWLQPPRRFDTQELATAYDWVMQNTNAGNRHLDDAFRNLAREMFVTPATHEARNDWWSTPGAEGLDRNMNPGLSPEQRASQNEFVSAAVAAAERQATLFADVFLRNYRQHGMEAFNMAMAAITQ